MAGRAHKLKGHCYLFAAHLYRYDREQVWPSVLVGDLLYTGGRTLPELTGGLIHQLCLPPEVRYVWVLDRGLLSRPLLLRALSGQAQFALGRVRCNQVVYFAPPAQRAWAQADFCEVWLKSAGHLSYGSLDSGRVQIPFWWKGGPAILRFYRFLLSIPIQ